MRLVDQMVALFYADDLAVTRIAEVLGISDGTVKSHLHDARTRLADLLTADDRSMS